jgi:hypothetical protein
MSVTLSGTESQALAVLRSLALQILPVTDEVVRGQDNRVAEPRGDFAVITPINRRALSTTVTTYRDDVPDDIHTRTDTQPTDLTVQVEIHGAAAGDNAQIFATLFRSDYATTLFAASGINAAPLYCDEARRTPFVTGEEQYEPRWSIDAHIQVNPGVTSPQQFADTITTDTILPGAIVPGIFEVDADAVPDFWNDDGALTLFYTRSYPHSAAGLPAGAVWSDQLAVAVVPGVVPSPAAPALFFGAVSAVQLIETGGGNLPIADPLVLNQLWNNGGPIAISAG